MSPAKKPKSYYKWRIHKIFDTNSRITREILKGLNKSDELLSNQIEAYFLLKEVFDSYGIVSLTLFGRRVYNRAFTLVFNLEGYPEFQKSYLDQMISNPIGVDQADVIRLRKRLGVL